MVRETLGGVTQHSSVYWKCGCRLSNTPWKLSGSKLAGSHLLCSGMSDSLIVNSNSLIPNSSLLTVTANNASPRRSRTRQCLSDSNTQAEQQGRRLRFMWSAQGAQGDKTGPPPAQTQSHTQAYSLERNASGGPSPHDAQRCCYSTWIIDDKLWFLWLFSPQPPASLWRVTCN